jgi:1-pyrroline-4-hydroxy-2-carboxylate deaminase
LLRMDAEPKFVQLIKAVEEVVGAGPTRVRPPRRELVGSERERAVGTVRAALATRPPLPPAPRFSS